MSEASVSLENGRHKFFQLPDLSSPSPLFENNNDDYNDLRREFEMNGRTKDLKEKDRSFSPSQCSTPMTNRKSQQWQPEDEFAFTYTDLIPIHPAPRPQYPFKKKIKPDKKSLTDVRYNRSFVFNCLEL